MYTGTVDIGGDGLGHLGSFDPGKHMGDGVVETG